MLKLPNIQILRAIAALAVVFYHDGIESTAICVATAKPCVYDFTLGTFGVPLFFMISGFIMVMTSWNNFAQSGAPLQFMRRRLTRIVPLYWLVTTVAVVGALVVPTMLSVPVDNPLYIAASYLFWPMARVNGLVRPIANLGWTLNLEIMFYAVFTLALFFDRKRGISLAVAFLCGATLLQMTDIFAAGGLLSSTPLNFWTDPIVLNFILGILVAILYKREFKVNLTEAWILIAISAAVLLIINNIHGALDAIPENHIINRGVLTLAVAFMFIAGALGPQIDVTKPFWRPGLLIGDASYSLYLVHPFFLRPIGKIWGKTIGGHLPVWTFTIVAIILALTVGVAVYMFVERPFTNYFARRSKLPVSNSKASLAH
jgi:exopolysaccharide production protein ExoZ